MSGRGGGESPYCLSLQHLGVALAERWATHVDLAQGQAASAIESLAVGFGDIARRLSATEGAEAMQADVDRLLVHLQFQDRTHQILSAVVSDMRRFAERLEQDRSALANGAAVSAIDVAQWLDEQRQHFTTLEQLGVAADAHTTDVTFF